jgi:hypothetical protein
MYAVSDLYSENLMTSPIVFDRYKLGRIKKEVVINRHTIT